MAAADDQCPSNSHRLVSKPAAPDWHCQEAIGPQGHLLGWSAGRRQLRKLPVVNQTHLDFLKRASIRLGLQDMSWNYRWATSAPMPTVALAVTQGVAGASIPQVGHHSSLELSDGTRTMSTSPWLVSCEAAALMAATRPLQGAVIGYSCRPMERCLMPLVAGSRDQK